MDSTVWRRWLLANSLLSLALAVIPGNCWSNELPAEKRQTICLDGVWQVAEGKLDAVPDAFDHMVPVPGLLDMANPEFETLGNVISDAERGLPWERYQKSDPLREAFWYRRTFKVNAPESNVAMLKVHKAFFGTCVFLNGHEVGTNTFNFTPGWFDLSRHIKTDGAENELANSGDSEIAPQVRAVVREAKSGRIVGQSAVEPKSYRPITIADTTDLRPGGKGRVDTTIKIANPHWWSPEDPFLYELIVDTGADTYKTRFAMRSFKTDPASGRVLLNGKPYYMRGSNVCVFRFSEDPLRGDKMWNREWVRKLHRQFKSMHWNSLRYCIGFPPGMWYDIADEAYQAALKLPEEPENSWHFDAVRDYGWFLVGQERFADANRVYRDELKRIGPTAPQANFWLNRLQFQVDPKGGERLKWNEPLVWDWLAAPKNRFGQEAQRRLVWVAKRAGNSDEFEKQALALAAEPRPAQLQFCLGDIFRGRGKAQAAVSMMAEAYARSPRTEWPGDPRGAAQLFRAQLGQGDLAAAEKLLDRLMPEPGVAKRTPGAAARHQPNPAKF